MPERIQLRRARGWRMPENTVKVARPGHWGNPFSVETFRRELAIALFRNAVLQVWQPALLAAQPELLDKAYTLHRMFVANHCPDEQRRLRGKDVACWCDLGEACHGDVLIELANQPTSEARTT